MTVAIGSGLINLKNYLEKAGFRTVDLADFSHKADAVVYKGISASLMQSCTPEAGGSILFVDCSGKTPFEVVQILRNKLYSPLF